MSARELSRFTTTNDSNIPILKKSLAGAKRSQGCSRLPEFQKYIETITKSCKDIDSDCTSFPEREKFPKGKHAVCKGIENTINHEKLNFDVISNKRKIKRQTNKKYSAVSRGVEVLHKFFSDFEDPRNWKIRNSGSHLKIEKLIEKFYPNPYTIHWENSKCQNSETQIIFEKLKTDESGDETLYDVFISKVDAETQDDLENANFDLVSADFQIILSEREDKSTKADLAFKNSETLHKSIPNNEMKRVGSKLSRGSNTSKLNISTNTTDNVSNTSFSNYVSKANSRASSVESILSRESQISYIKKRQTESKTRINAKEISPRVKKSKTLTEVHENCTDYDLGKLKLLNSSDSDVSISKNCPLEETQTKSENNIATDDFVTEISSEICNEISKTNDLNDLLQIYEVMNKATESFLYLTSIKKTEFENEKPMKNSDSQNPEDVESQKVQNFDCSEKEDSSNANKNDGNSAEEKNVVAEIKSDLDSEKKDTCDNEDDIVMPLNLNDGEEEERKVEDEIFDANQKINEVLQYMNDCLLKFGNDDKLLPEKNDCEEDSKKTKSSENFLTDCVDDEKQKTSTLQTNDYDLVIESSSQTRFLNHTELSSNLSEVPEKINKNQNARIRCKRKSKFLNSVSSVKKTNTVIQQSFNSNEPSTSDVNVPPNAELVAIYNENTVQVAEGQNELGAYTEKPLDTNVILKEDCRILKKSVFPLSTKARRSQPETYKTLKDALEAEEKLLKLSKPESKKIITSKPESQILIQRNAISGYSPVGGFENLNSGFVFCISPLTQNLSPTAVVTPSLSIPQPLSLSLFDFTSWNLKPLREEYPAEKIFIPSWEEHKAYTHTYSFKLEMLLIINNPRVTYYARPVCFTTLIAFPKIQKEYLLEYSKRQIRAKPLNKFSIVNLNTPETNGFCIRNSVTFTTSKSNLLSNSDSGTNINSYDIPVEALIKTIQETENIFLLQHHSNSGNNPINNFESFCSCRTNELLKKGPFDNELEKGNDKEKVQNLLLRTYKLQKKLQQYLRGITQQARLPRSFMRQDFGIYSAEKTSDVSMAEGNLKPKKLHSLTELSGQLLTAEKETKTNEAVTVNVQMVDRSTTYVPPVEAGEKICEKPNKLNQNSKDFHFLGKEEETSPNLENDEDDTSSTYSFKSSNDFSEANELHNEPTTLVNKSSDIVPNGDVLKKIFSQLELLKHSVDAGNLGRQEKDNLNLKEEEDVKNNELVESDPKNPAKILKTVFKGRKSSTELTIGLKDVPMTKVKNISVEKTKFSPNHTKISICISKENPNEMKASDNPDSKSMSSYFFDHMRPSLSLCQTEYSKVEDNVSKSSQSLNEESDDDDDDFKSVGSTAADSKSGSSTNGEKSKPETQGLVKMSQTKNFTKHKFDFYRKMDMNVEGYRVRQKSLSNSLWRFKELEPLKQALTELQIRMRSIKREAVMNSNDFYERALKLAKMSAGYCQSCGTRAVIPDDTFGYYKSLLPRRPAQHRRSRHFKTSITPNSSFYSFRSSNAEVSGQFCDLDIKGGSSFSLNRTTQSNRTVLRSSLQDMPILLEKM